jgi:tetratricopeptide (TPR) repeat protein
LEEAVASYDRALQLKPDDYYAWNNRGVALRELGRLEETVASYDRALQLKPDDDYVWYKRGNALRDLGRLEEAVASYDRALQLKPDYYEAQKNRDLILADDSSSLKASVNH